MSLNDAHEYFNMFAFIKQILDEAWDLDLKFEITPDTRFFANLEFAALDMFELASQLQESTLMICFETVDMLPIVHIDLGEHEDQTIDWLVRLTLSKLEAAA